MTTLRLFVAPLLGQVADQCNTNHLMSKASIWNANLLISASQNLSISALLSDSVGSIIRVLATGHDTVGAWNPGNEKIWNGGKQCKDVNGWVREETYFTFSLFAQIATPATTSKGDWEWPPLTPRLHDKSTLGQFHRLWETAKRQSVKIYLRRIMLMNL